MSEHSELIVDSIKAKTITLQATDDGPKITMGIYGHTAGIFIQHADKKRSLNLAIEQNGTVSICLYDSHQVCQGAIGLWGDHLAPTLQSGDPRHSDTVKIVGFDDITTHILAAKTPKPE